MSATGEASNAAKVGAFATCTAIWGSTFLFIRIGNDTLAPVWAAAVRLAIATVLLSSIVALTRQPWPRGPALVSTLQFGLFQFGLSFPLLYWGETRLSSGMSAVLFATVPLTTALLARAFGLEKLTPRKIGGAVFALFGVGLIFLGEMRERVPAAALVAVFLAATIACTGSVLLKRGPRQSALATNAVGAAVGAVSSFVLSTLAGESHRIPRDSSAILSIFYLAVVGSIGAFVLWAWLVQNARITRISYIAVLVPIVATGLGALVRHERVGGLSFLGAAVVLAGVVVGIRASELPVQRSAARVGA